MNGWAPSNEELMRPFINLAALTLAVGSLALACSTAADGDPQGAAGSATTGFAGGGASAGASHTSGGAEAMGGAAGSGGVPGGGSGQGGSASGGMAQGGAPVSSGGAPSGGVVTGGEGGAGGSSGGMGGKSEEGGTTAGGGASGAAGAGGGSGSGGSGGLDGAGGAGGGGACEGPIGVFSGELATGIAFMDTDGERVNAHGGGIVVDDGTFYLHGEYFSSTTTDNNFHGVSMYSSRDLATWKNEGIILPTQASGELGPNRKGERPHIIRCPATGEFVLFAHAASEDYQTDKEVVYATSSTVNGQYAYQGPLKNASGQLIVHSDMSAFADGTGAYVVTEGGHAFTLGSDCHSWLSDKSVSAVNGDSGGIESPTVFEANGTYYWLGSYKTGWRANNNFYSTAPSITGSWTYRGYLAPVSNPNDNISDERTWLSQVTWVQPVEGCEGTVYVYIGDHWDGTESTAAPGRHNELATYVVQPLVFDGMSISLPTYHATWQLDVAAGTWTE